MIDKKCKDCDNKICSGFYNQDYCFNCQSEAFKELHPATREYIVNLIKDAKEDIMEFIDLRIRL